MSIRRYFPAIGTAGLLRDLVSGKRRKKNHQWVCQPLLDNLDKDHIKFINVGPDILRYLGKRHPSEIFNYQGGGHLNEEGYRLLAHIVYDYLSAQHLTQGAYSGPTP